MRSMGPTWVAVVAAVLLAAGTLYMMTHGFGAVTVDGVRQLAIRESPRSLPSIELIDSRGHHANLRALVADRAYTVIALVYTRCTSLCLVMASSEAFLQERLREAGLEKEVRLLTISFDPARDTPEILARYASRVKADPSMWTVSTVADPAELDELLEVFNVVVIPDGTGEYIHNGALFLADADGRLFEAVGPDQADVAFERIAAELGRR